MNLEEEMATAAEQRRASLDEDVRKMVELIEEEGDNLSRKAKRTLSRVLPKMQREKIFDFLIKHTPQLPFFHAEFLRLLARARRHPTEPPPTPVTPTGAMRNGVQYWASKRGMTFYDDTPPF